MERHKEEWRKGGTDDRMEKWRDGGRDGGRVGGLA